MIYDERRLSEPRYHVLLASAPIGKRDHGRVWTHRGTSYVVTTDNKVEIVSSIVTWLQTLGMLELGPKRELGGQYLVPTERGRQMLETMIHGNKEE